ncbi:hypothetical protein [Bradyrhizobium zhanjiangense]|uniref:hypothetical protein n=1 Tax=Bradyrhizobium TaxID=374 RepID=UPI0013E8C9F6|nr:hypothetical protein [Bradyrhizobium zhanjiangense]
MCDEGVQFLGTSIQEDLAGTGEKLGAICGWRAIVREGEDWAITYLQVARSQA